MVSVIKSKRLSIKLLPTDKAALEKLASVEGESLAVVVRRLIRRETLRLIGDEHAGVVPAAQPQPEGDANG
jgi:hypothetical protein